MYITLGRQPQLSQTNCSLCPTTACLRNSINLFSSHSMGDGGEYISFVSFSYSHLNISLCNLVDFIFLLYLLFTLCTSSEEAYCTVFTNVCHCHCNGVYNSPATRHQIHKLNFQHRRYICVIGNISLTCRFPSTFGIRLE